MVTKCIAWLIDEIEIFIVVCIFLLLVMSFLQFILCNNKNRILKFIPLILAIFVMIIAVFNIVDAYKYKPNSFDNLISVAIMVWSFMLLAMYLGCLLGWITSIIYKKHLANRQMTCQH